MKRALLAAALVAASLGAAHALGIGKLGFQFGRVGAPGGKVPAVVPLTNLRITNTGDFRVTSTGDNRAISP